MSRSSVALSLVPILVMIGVGTMVYAFLEGWSLPDALYATVITLTTVGYGDFTPHTLVGRLFAIPLYLERHWPGQLRHLNPGCGSHQMGTRPCSS